MKSMTGYAKKQCLLDNKKITIEIKTLNSKQIDANVKMPSTYMEKELEIRSLLNRLERGKIDLLLTEEANATNSVQLNGELLVNRHQALAQLAQKNGWQCNNDQLLEIIAKQPDVWSAPKNEEVAASDYDILLQTVADAVEEVDRFRLQEGLILKQDFVKHVDLIEQKLNQIPQYETERIDTAKKRIYKYFADCAAKEIDQNRFEQELIYYLEKLDITEEKVRLQKHIDYFRDTMEHEPSCGKKLGFIAQEMGREINTTGSKANHVEIQKLVVEMKDELEKIKEQLGNIL